MTESEREAGRSLQQYVLHARAYAAGDKPSLAEMDRREQKINKVWLALVRTWLTRTRRP